MFKHKYKKDNEFIKPDSEKLIEIENKIRFVKLKNNKKHFYSVSFPSSNCAVNNTLCNVFFIQIESF